jgi:hypothetical protein
MLLSEWSYPVMRHVLNLLFVKSLAQDVALARTNSSASLLLAASLAPSWRLSSASLYSLPAVKILDYKRCYGVPRLTACPVTLINSLSMSADTRADVLIQFPAPLLFRCGNFFDRLPFDFDGFYADNLRSDRSTDCYGKASR